MHPDSNVLVSDKIEKEDDGMYRVRRYKCGCSFHSLLDENGKEKGLQGYSVECSLCFYGDNAVTDIL